MEKFKSFINNIPHIDDVKKMAGKVRKALLYFLVMFCMFVLFIVYYSFSVGTMMGLLFLLFFAKFAPLLIFLCVVLGVFLWWL